MKVEVYVEGGDDGKFLRTRFREGFSSIFANADLAGWTPKIIACGARSAAFGMFRTAIASRSTTPNAPPDLSTGHG